MVVHTETALEWFQRSQHKRAAADTPTDPSSGAWAFLRGASGITPVDAAWRTPSANSCLPVITLEGSVGKTWTLLSLAARFVVATRKTRFAADTASTEDKTSCAPSIVQKGPFVILLDSKFDMTIPKLAYIVRSTLLREPGITDQTLETEIEDCMSRIHLAMVDEVKDAWVPILECLRCKLKTLNKNPILMLWDGFHSDTNGQPNQIEVRRQVLRLLHDCSIALVVTGAATTSSTTSNTSKNTIVDWLSDNKERDVYRVRLEQRSGKDCYGLVNGSRLPFSLSLGGVLS